MIEGEVLRRSGIRYQHPAIEPMHGMHKGHFAM